MIRFLEAKLFIEEYQDVQRSYVSSMLCMLYRKFIYADLSKCFYQRK